MWWCYYKTILSFKYILILYNLKIFSNKNILHIFHHITVILVSFVFMGLYNFLLYATSNVKILPKFSESFLSPSSGFTQFFKPENESTKLHFGTLVIFNYRRSIIF